MVHNKISAFSETLFSIVHISPPYSIKRQHKHVTQTASLVVFNNFSKSVVVDYLQFPNGGGLQPTGVVGAPLMTAHWLIIIVCCFMSLAHLSSPSEELVSCDRLHILPPVWDILLPPP